MAACPRCGSFLVAGTACEFCARYGGPAPQAPQPWQPPEWTPYQAQASAPYQYQAVAQSVDTGIRPLELSWAGTRVTWCWVLVGAIGALSIGSYWVITKHPDIVGQYVLGFLLSQSSSLPQDQQSGADLLQIIVGFVLSWLPLTGLVLHGMGLSQQSSLSQIADLSPLLWQGVAYLALAVLIWRRSMIALVLASLLFLADSGIFAYGIFKLFQLFWDQYQKYQDLIQSYPDLATQGNPADIGHWPWILIVPIIVRLAVLWLLFTSFGAVRLLAVHRKRLKAARREAEAQAA